MAVYCDHCGQAMDCDICKNPFCKLNQSDICQSECCVGCKDAIECAESYRVKLIAARQALGPFGQIYHDNAKEWDAPPFNSSGGWPVFLNDAGEISVENLRAAHEALKGVNHV